MRKEAPAVFERRLATIAFAGVALIGLAVAARALLDSAGHPPSGASVLLEASHRPAESASVARYEWERGRQVR
jgi:hypothetical protein